ncbi:MAG: DNA repair protein RecO [Oscillibacter sp.]|nr:DNA repair protein RecO [Oscillibacter sp.]
MPVAYFVTRGIVLRETVTRESDKILTLLSEDRGKMPVIVRGARRKNSRFAAAAQSLAWSEWTLFRRGDWYHAKEGNTIELFSGLRGRLETLSLGFYFAELAEAAAVEEAPARPLLRLLLNGLYALSALSRPLPLVKAAFELKFLCVAGFAPLADSCAYCGRPDPPDPMLDTVQGVLHCRNCAPGNAGNSVPLCPASLSALRHVVYGDERRLYSFRLAPDALKRFADAAERFLFVQMERRFRTLEFYKSLLPLKETGL